jgi:hypothetical protein
VEGCGGVSGRRKKKRAGKTARRSDVKEEACHNVI